MLNLGLDSLKISIANIVLVVLRVLSLLSPIEVMSMSTMPLERPTGLIRL